MVGLHWFHRLVPGHGDLYGDSTLVEVLIPTSLPPASMPVAAQLAGARLGGFFEDVWVEDITT